MYRTFSSRCVKPISHRPPWVGRILLGVFLLFAGVSARAAEPDEKPAAKRSQAELRACLPTIRKKALFDNERENAAALRRCLGMYEVFLEGGLANTLDKGQVETAFLRSGIRVWQRETEYRDSVDEFTSRVRSAPDRRQQMEDATISPLA